MNNIEALEWRYATKKFDEKKVVAVEKLEILKQAFNLTATSYGLQPIKMVVIRNKEIQKKLTQAAFNQQQVTTASHVLVLCIENKVDNSFIEQYFEKVREKRETPAEILKPFKTFLTEDFKIKPQDEIDKWATNQAYLAMGTLMTVCATEKIDACPMEGFNSFQFDEILSLKKQNLKSVLALPIGYRAQDDMFSSFKKVRRELSEVIIEIN